MNTGAGDGGMMPPRQDQRMHVLDGGMAVGIGSVTVPMADRLDAMAPPDAPWPILVGANFPKASWDPSLRAQVILGEFGASGWQNQVTVPPDLPTIGDLTSAASLDAEINQLIGMMKYRAAYAGEIVAQAEDLSLYWSDLLVTSATSRPATWTLVAIGIAVGQLVAMRFKYQYQRARPVQVYPAIMPMIITPAHASYPNAHALQSHLISECIILACDAVKEPLRAIADRIGQNREIAGVHFPSDRALSLKLYPQVMQILQNGPAFKEVVAEAAREWQGVTTSPHNPPALSRSPHRPQEDRQQ